MLKDRTGRGPISIFRNQSTVRKLAVLTAMLLSVSVTVGGTALIKMADLNTSGHVVGEQTVPYLTHLSSAAVTAKSAANDERGFLLTGDKKYVTEFDGRIPTVQAELRAASGTATNATQRSAVVAVATGFQSWVDLVHAEFALHATNPVKATALALNANRDARKAYEASSAVATTQAKTALAASIAEEDAAANTGRIIVLVLLALGLVVGALLCWFIARMIANPLRKAVKVLDGLAEGRLDQTLDVDSKDEVGQMARALNAAMAKLRETMTVMGNNAQGLASSSEELSSVSSQMTGSADESATQANLVSAAAEQVSRNVQTVATGTEEMSASIREIAKNAHDAAGVAAQAVHVAETTTLTVAKLGESSAEIGNVIKVINSIAEQTNLLALNATIEAARAGEAGKGFAVVANEVKELAQETSKATEDIGRRIEAIQSDTAAAVAAITEISAIIAEINDTQSTIASAVEEQTATTNEMGRNVTEAATGSSDIAENITGVARSASDTTAAASSTSQAADELARMASDLQQLVGQFSY